MMLFANATDPGRVRSNNQDTNYCDPKGRFCIVADGMGGHAAGATASWLAVEGIRERIEHGWGTVPARELLTDAIAYANGAILTDQRNHPERQDMGTTVVVLLCDPEGQCWSAHIGDSRLYRMRAGELKQVTEDHTLIARSIRQGELTPAEARTHPWRHVLERCLGRPDTGPPTINAIPIEEGDRFLLCSDGLTDELEDHEIAEFFLKYENIQDLPHSLIEAAKENGGRDNVTAVIAEYRSEYFPSEESPPSPDPLTEPELVQEDQEEA
jgi:protein phosphatase